MYTPSYTIALFCRCLEYLLLQFSYSLASIFLSLEGPLKISSQKDFQESFLDFHSAFLFQVCLLFGLSVVQPFRLAGKFQKFLTLNSFLFLPSTRQNTVYASEFPMEFHYTQFNLKLKN